MCQYSSPGVNTLLTSVNDRSRYPDSGGAFKVQIYSPYIVVNKTGLPYSVRSTRSTRAGFQDAAGDTQPGAHVI